MGWEEGAGLIGRALSSGIDTYQKERDSQDDRDFKRKQLAAQLAMHGLKEDGAGNYIKLAGAGDDLDTQYKKLQIEQLRKKLASGGGAEELTPGEEAADKAFAKDVADYSYSGGKSSVDKNIQKYETAISTLEKNPNASGGLTTRIPILNSDLVQDTINPKGSQVRDDIRGAIQSTLKQVLGGQFTEKDAEGIFNRAYNPRLSAKENVRRAKLELEGLKGMAGQKEDAIRYFVANGTMKGFKGVLPSVAALTAPKSSGGGLLKDKAAGLLDGAGANADDAPPDVVNYAKKHGISVEQAAQIKASRGGK